MTRVLIGIVGLLVIIAAAVLIAPSFVDWNTQKSRLEEEVRAATGRTLTIRGDMSLALLPAPALAASSVSFQNIDGSDTPAMVELDELRVRVAFWPLLSGRVQFESVVLVRPRIILEVLPDGRRNWDFGTATAGGSTGAGFVDQIQVDSFKIEQGTLVYRDAVAGIEERFEAIEAQIAAETTKGPFAVEGQGRARGLPVSFNLALGRILEAGATRFKAVLGLPEAEASGELSGTFSIHPDSVALRGNLEVHGKHLAEVLSAFTGGPAGSLPKALQNPFSASATLSGDLEQVRAEELSLAVGENALTGALEVNMGPKTVVRANLGTTRIDLDRLIADATTADGEGTGAPESPETAGKAPPDGQSPGPVAIPTLPPDLDAEVEIAVDALVYRGQVVRQLRLVAAARDGLVEISDAGALLPGGSDIHLSGALESGDQGPMVAGQLEAASDSLRAVLDWLGVPVGTVPPDRLRKMSLSGKYTLSASQVDVREVDLRIDTSRVVGAAVVVLRERPGMGVGLSIDSLNLDPYLGLFVGGGQGGGAPAGEGGAARSGNPLQAFDANLDLQIGTLIYQGTTAETLRLKGTLQGGDLVFKEASIGNLAGNSARYEGSLTGLATTPKLSGLLELRAKAPARLARLVGLEPGGLEAIGPFNLNGNIEATLERVALNTRVAALGGQFGLDGTLSPLASPLSFDLTVDGKNDDLAKLVNRLSGQTRFGPLGRLDAKARVSGTPAAIRVADLTGIVGPARLSGGLSVKLGGARPSVSDLDLSFAARHQNLAALLSALGLSSPVSPALGGLDLKGRVTGDQSNLKVSGLEGSIGPIGVKGALAANLSGAAAAVTGVDLDLSVKHPTLAELLGALGVTSPVSPALGGVDLIAHAAGSQNDLKVSGLQGRVGPISLNGELAANLAGPAPAVTGLDVNVEVRHSSLAELVAALGRPGSVDPGFGGVDLRGRVVGTPEQIEVRNLAGKIGPGDVSGTLAADLRGAKPNLKVDLDTGPLPVAALMAAGGAGGATGGAGGGNLSPRWSTRPIDFSGLHKVNAEVALRSQALIYDAYQLRNADLRAVLRDGVVDLDRLAGTIFNGAVQLAGRFAAGSELDSAVSLNAIEIELGQLLRGQTDRVSGPVTLNASLTSRGSSEAELVSRLAGQGTIEGTLRIRAAQEQAAGQAVQLGAGLAEQLFGIKLDSVKGAAQESTRLLNAFARAPAPLRGSFNISRGLLRTEDTRVTGQNAYALTRGVVDLPAWLIDTQTDVYVSEKPDSPSLTLNLTGPIDKPNQRVRSDFLSRGSQGQQQPAQQQQQLGPAPSGQQGPAPTQQKQPQVQDLLQQLIKKGLNQ